MITEFFVLGGVAFWVLTGIFTLLFFWCTEEEESGGFNVFLPVLLILSLVVFGNLGGCVIEHPWRWVGWSVGYLFIGLAWSFPRWFILLRRLKHKYDEELADFVRKGNSLDNEKDRVDWSYFIETQRPYRGTGMQFSTETGKLQPPQFESCRVRMLNWVILWPWSMLWTFVRDGLKRFVDWVIGLFGRWHQAISEWVFRG